MLTRKNRLKLSGYSTDVSRAVKFRSTTVKSKIVPSSRSTTHVRASSLASTITSRWKLREAVLTSTRLCGIPGPAQVNDKAGMLAGQVAQVSQTGFDGLAFPLARRHHQLIRHLCRRFAHDPQIDLSHRRPGENLLIQRYLHQPTVVQTRRHRDGFLPPIHRRDKSSGVLKW